MPSGSPGTGGASSPLPKAPPPSEWTVFLPGKPVGKGSPRFSINWRSVVLWVARALQSQGVAAAFRTGWMPSGKRPFAQTRPDPKSDAWEAVAAVVVQKAWTLPPLDEPCSLSALAVFPRSKSKTRKTKPNPRLLHAVKPDGSNVLKAVEDALVKGDVLFDDGRLWDTRIRKVIGRPDEPVGVYVRVSWGSGATLWP